MTHIYRYGQSLCGIARPNKVTCPDCLMAWSGPVDEDGGLDLARELVTLCLLDEDSFSDRVRELSGETRPTVEGLLLALVAGVAATWDSADDFSAHVLAALAEDET